MPTTFVVGIVYYFVSDYFTIIICSVCPIHVTSAPKDSEMYLIGTIVLSFMIVAGTSKPSIGLSITRLRTLPSSTIVTPFVPSFHVTTAPNASA